MSGMQQEVEALFFGSGVQDLYPHWRSQMPGEGSRFTPYGSWEAGQAPSTWAYRITITDPLNSERLMERVITHSVLYMAAEMINDGNVDTEKPFHPLDAETGRACSAWVHSDELDAFDPHTLDQVLQVAVFGGLLHPHFQVREKA